MQDTSNYPPISSTPPSSQGSNEEDQRDDSSQEVVVRKREEKLFEDRGKFEARLVHLSYPLCCHDGCHETSYGAPMFFHEGQRIFLCIGHQLASHVLWPELLDTSQIYELHTRSLLMVMYKDTRDMNNIQQYHYHV